MIHKTRTDVEDLLGITTLRPIVRRSADVRPRHTLSPRKQLIHRVYARRIKLRDMILGG